MTDPTSETVRALTEDDYADVVDEAYWNLRRHNQSARGQMVMPQDGIEWHVMKATEDRIRELLKEGRL